MSDGIPVRIHLSAAELKTLERIAARRGVTVREVIEEHLRAGIEHRKPKPPRTRRSIPIEDRPKYGNRITPDQVQLIEQLTRQGKSAAVIAEQLGCHVRTVENWRAKLDLGGVRPMGRYA